MERLVVQMRCSRSGTPFQLVVARASAHATYRLAEVRPGSSASAVSAGSSASPAGPAAAASANAIDASMLDLSGFRCPSCAFDTKRSSLPYAFVQCSGCSSLVCPGTVRPAGKQVGFSCGYCGTAGRLGAGSLSEIPVGGESPALPEGGRRLLNAAKRLLRGGPSSNDG